MSLRSLPVPDAAAGPCPTTATATTPAAPSLPTSPPPPPPRPPPFMEEPIGPPPPSPSNPPSPSGCVAGGGGGRRGGGGGGRGDRVVKLTGWGGVEIPPPPHGAVDSFFIPPPPPPPGTPAQLDPGCNIIPPPSPPPAPPASTTPPMTTGLDNLFAGDNTQFLVHNRRYIPPPPPLDSIIIPPPPPGIPTQLDPGSNIIPPPPPPSTSPRTTRRSHFLVGDNTQFLMPQEPRAISGISPATSIAPTTSAKHHDFVPHTYQWISKCHVCNTEMWGLTKQGLCCTNCKLDVHQGCQSHGSRVACEELVDIASMSSSPAYVTNEVENQKRSSRKFFGPVRKRKTSSGPKVTEENQSRGIWYNYEKIYIHEKRSMDLHFVFPEDDISVKRFPRTTRLRCDPTDPIVAAFIDEYSSDRVFVDHRYSNFGAFQNSFQTLKADPHLFFAAAEMQDLIPRVPPLPSPPPQPPSSVPELTLSSKRVTLFIHVGDLHVGGEIVEPLCGTMSIVDLSQEKTQLRKVSEDFHFHLTPTVPPAPPPASAAKIAHSSSASTEPPSSPFSTYSAAFDDFKSPSIREALVTLEQPSQSLYVVIKIFRVFHGDIEKDLQAYSKGKLKAQYARQAQQELNEYSVLDPADYTSPLPLQPLMWGFFAAYPAEINRTAVSENLKKQEANRKLFINEFYPLHGSNSLESICRWLEKPKSLKKVRPISAEMEISVNVTPPTETIAVVIPYSSLPAPSAPSPRKTHMKKLQHFTHKDKEGWHSEPPHFDYVNDLYVYPETVLLNAFAYHNTQIGVQLIDGRELEKTCSIVPFKVMHGTCYDFPKPSQVDLRQTAFSSVSTNEKVPEFSDEIKISLPADLSHHTLLFTFYNVTPKPKIKTIFGYSRLRLFNEEKNTILKNGRHKLPVAKSLVELVNMTEDTLDIAADTKVKNFFSVHTEVVSSIYTTNENLARLIRGVWRNSALLKDNIRASSELEYANIIADVPPEACIMLFPFLMSTILNIMSTGSDVGRHAAFRALMVLLPKITKQLHPKSETELLDHYVKFVFDPMRPPIIHPYHETLARHWREVLDCSTHNLQEKSGSSADAVECGASNLTWFLFEMIAKSAAVWAYANNKLCTDNRAERFPSDFSDNVCKVIVQVVQNFLLQFTTGSIDAGTNVLQNIRSIPVFINNMFPLIDRGLLINALVRCVRGIDPLNNDAPVIELFKMTILRGVADYEHYLPLNLPVLYDSDFVNSPEGLETVFWNRHPIAGLILNEVQSCISKSYSIRDQALKTLKALFLKHQTDRRYCQSEQQKLIATIYFPLILSALSNDEIISKFEPVHKHEYLICAFYVLKNVQRSLLKSWWSRDTEKRNTQFLELIWSCIKYLEQPTLNDVLAVAVKICQEYTTDRHDFLKSCRTPVFGLLSVLTSVLERTPADQMSVVQQACQMSVVQQTFGVLDLIVESYGHQIFVPEGNSYCELLCNKLLNFMNGAHNSEFLIPASELFRKMLIQNFQQTGDMHIMKIQTIVAAARLLALQQDSQQLLVLQVLEHIENVIDRRAPDYVDNPSEFKDNAKEVTIRLKALFRYWGQVRSRKHPESQVKLFLQAVMSYNDKPDLLIAYLEGCSSKKHLRVLHHWEEAAQCQIMIAYLISQYLILENRLVTPNLSAMDGLVKGIMGCQKNAKLWCEKSMIDSLKKAVRYLEKVNIYELFIETNPLLSTRHKREKKCPLRELTCERGDEWYCVHSGVLEPKSAVTAPLILLPKLREILGEEEVHPTNAIMTLGHLFATLIEKGNGTTSVLDEVIPNILRVKILLDVALELQSLHQQSPPVAHGKICPDNILVLSLDINRGPWAKIKKDSDSSWTILFDSIRMPESAAVSLADMNFLAPEVLPHLPFDTPADIWSFGMTFSMVMDPLKRPYTHLTSSHHHEYLWSTNYNANSTTSTTTSTAAASHNNNDNNNTSGDYRLVPNPLVAGCRLLMGEIAPSPFASTHNGDVCRRLGQQIASLCLKSNPCDRAKITDLTTIWGYFLWPPSSP
ncbi:DOCK family protein [Pelomyxa schiedti]|nr:DOCK family protein [Pelomyxa schiedti]